MASKKAYYQHKKHVLEYLDMAKKFDGRGLIEILKKHLTKGSSVLELGMGPGNDLDILKEDFNVSGSDISPVFLQLYKEKHPDADIFQLDAKNMKIDRKFDCIYSNKVLHHLSTRKLKKSIKKQSKILTPEGIVFHSFWNGDKEEIYKGLKFVYYTEEELMDYFIDYFDIIDIQTFKEMEEDDSIYIVAKKSLT